jgi:hypothetical protein
MRLIKIFIVIVVLFSGCKKSFVTEEEQLILFQREYINYAWGYQHQGYLIDNQGNILTYTNPETWNFPDKDQLLNENQIMENLGQCMETGSKISEHDLNKYSGYIRNISSSKVTARKNVAADAGSLLFVCYQYSPSTGMYKAFIIREEGDFTCENLNFYTKKVVSWMNDQVKVLNPH